jgi:serine/threonine protein kinase
MGQCTSLADVSVVDDDMSVDVDMSVDDDLHAALSLIRKYYDVKSDRILGSGMNGDVFEAINRISGKVCAVKVVPNDKSAQLELEAYKCLQHSNIAELLDAYEDESFVIMVLELCNGGELFDGLAKNGRYSEAEAARVLRQVLLAVAYMHDQGFVHADLKLENILYESHAVDADIKLIDFGVCQRCSGKQALFNKVGTVGYMAPEIIKGRYTNKCDLFSIGVIAYMLLSNESPFGMRNEQKYESRVLKESFKFGKNFDDVSSVAKEFVAGLLAPMSERMSALQALQHPWWECQGYSHDLTSKSTFDAWAHCRKTAGNILDRPLDTISEASTRLPSY